MILFIKIRSGTVDQSIIESVRWDPTQQEADRDSWAAV